MNDILQQFGFDASVCTVRLFGNGLINRTSMIESRGEQFILQKINHHIFKSPEAIANNIRLIGEYLKQYHPHYLFVTPLLSVEGNDIVITGEGYYRVFPFIKGSHTIDVVKTPQQAFEAAKQFGQFTKYLSGFNTTTLNITLPDFHNLSLRYEQFELAVQEGDNERIQQSAQLIQFITKHHSIVDEYEKGKQDFKIRVTHHDTKISNVLFDKTDKGICVIDLDTVMPGYFISDVGDMMRTYLCHVSEEEKDLSKIGIRNDFYKAIVEGYSSEMGAELTQAEKKYFLFAGQFMIYMQALRFLTDHLNKDTYYGSKYEGQNFIRAANQVTLLQRLLEFTPH